MSNWMSLSETKLERIYEIFSFIKTINSVIENSSMLENREIGL